MPFSVLNWDTSYHIFFPNKTLFPIEPYIFRCTCFVRDVRVHVSKLDPKSLKCIFLGYSRVQKGYQCYYPSLRIWFRSMSHFLRMYLSLYLRTTRVRGRKTTCLFILSQTGSFSYSSKTSYHLGLHSKPTPPSLEPSTNCFDIRSSS